jgi:hypothetical protein
MGHQSQFGPREKGRTSCKDNALQLRASVTEIKRKRDRDQRGGIEFPHVVRRAMSVFLSRVTSLDSARYINPSSICATPDWPITEAESHHRFARTKKVVP